MTRLSLPVLTLVLVGILLLPGCSRRYIITTVSGAKVVTASKPRLVQSKYVYKDAHGLTNEISALRVRIVEPYSKEALGTAARIPDLQ